MHRALTTLALALALLLTPAHPGRAADPSPDFNALPQGAPTVPGLSLPAGMEVPADAGLVKVKAQCEGAVQFYAIGSAPIQAESAGKTLVLSVPNQPGAQIVVLATALVVTKGPNGAVASASQTPFARTDILVVAPKRPAPAPAPTPAPTPAPAPRLDGKAFVTMIFDPATVTQAQADVLNSAKLRGLADTAVRLADRNDPWLKAKRLDGEAKSLPWVVIQDASGKVVASQPLPAAEAEALSLLQSLRGK